MIAYDRAPLPEFAATRRLVCKELALLQRTRDRLFAETIDRPWILALVRDDERSERVDAFAARCARLQETLEDRLFPHLLALLGQQGRSLIGRLNLLERLGLREHAQSPLAWLNIGNQFVHGYVENPEDFHDSSRIARDYSAALGAVVARIDEWRQNLGIDERELS